MARHDSPKKPTARRALALLATAGAALGAGTTMAAADTTSLLGVVNTRPTDLGRIDPQSGLQATTGTLGYVTGPVAGLKPNPLAGTGVDPLDNGVGTQLADFKPMTSQALTGPVAQAQSIASIPVVGQAAGLLSQQ
jgi:ABC-type sugar transport system substrate-binding protein